MEEHKEARFIVETLAKQGFIAYYAGGWVRDLLLQHPSDDIDIATNAPPETIQALFPHTVPIGIAFGIILVIVNDKPYEVATFRQDLDYKDGRRPSKIFFTTAVEDAKRRDFTINGMFYDPLREEIFDYVGGKKDLEKKVIRAIGNPIDRIKEDRLRMLRALRLACRFDFTIEQKTSEAIEKEAPHLLSSVAIERICQELLKAKAFKKLPQMLLLMHQYGLLEAIFPSLKKEESIEKLLLTLTHYPHEAPLIAYLLPLFPNYTLEEKKALCKRLKLSSSEEQFLLLLEKRRALILKNDLVEWTYFYAEPLSSLVSQILATESQNPKTFLEEDLLRREKLFPFIQRVIEKKPLISASFLLEEGILPGKTMGLLLKKAEELSISYQTQDTSFLLTLLKKLEIWPNIDK